MPKSQHAQRIFFLKQSYNELYMVHQKVPKLYFQRQFSMSKIDGASSKKTSFKNINLGDQFFVKNIFFLTSIFEPLYFLKSCPIFDELVLPVFSKNTMVSFEDIEY